MAHTSFLSQDEVDALMAGMTGGTGKEPGIEQPAQSDTTAVPAASANGVRPYDLGAPDRVVLQRMRNLELINERFARGLRGKLLGFMRRNADITAGSIQVEKYGQFERNLPVPSNLNLVTMKPLRGTGLFNFEPALVFLIIDNLFGGHGRYAMRVEGREFTTTEQRIIRRLLDLALEAYEAAWQDVYKVKPEYLRSEMHTKFASISRASELAVLTSFTIELGACSGKLDVCLPYSMIEPIRSVLTSPLQDAGSSALDARWTQQLSCEVRSADVELTAQFAQLNASVGQLVQWKAGDVIALDVPETVEAFVGSTPLARCHYGTANGRHALKVQALLPGRKEPFLSGNQ